MEELVRKNPELAEGQLDFYNMTREEKMTFHWKRFNRLMQLKPEIFTELNPMRSV